MPAFVSAVETVGDVSGSHKGANREATDDEIKGQLMRWYRLRGVWIFWSVAKHILQPKCGAGFMTGVMSRHVVTLGQFC